jgi:hypothetical protein
MTALDAGAVVREGERRAGREAGSTSPWRAALQLLVDCARGEGGLSGAGRDAFAEKLATFVAERLTADAWFETEPGIRARPLPVRFVVAGLARSGTTFLHRLLSCDPDVEFLPTWQAFRAVPPLDGPDTRHADVVAMVEQMRVSNPDAFRIHPTDPDAPEEEVFLLQHSFASMLFALSCPLPSYNDWLRTTDHTEAYRYAFDLLRLNEYVAGRPVGRPRVMKSPQFVLDLGVASRLAADAVIVQTHRDPVDLVGSYCSTYASSRRRWCASVEPLALGRERLGFLAAMAERSMSVRDAAEANGDGGRFVDVHYAALVADPLGTVERIYDAAGLRLTGPARTAMAAWVDAHPQNAAGAHRYDLAEYGLDRAAVEAVLADYVARFEPGVE